MEQMGRRRAGLVFGILVFMLLVGVFGAVLNVPVAQASGTIYIRADGSIDPPDAPISTVDNVTYTLTDNITSDADGIVVERDNIVIEGANYLLQGSGASSSNGIALFYRSNVTVKNTMISLFEVGIRLGFSAGCNVINNTILSNTHGVAVAGVEETVVEKNSILSNVESGILIIGRGSVSIKENKLKWNKNGIATDSANIHSGILIVDNEISFNQENGIYLYSAGYLGFGSDPVGRICDATISANNISSNGKDGVFIGSYGYGWHGTFSGYSGYGYIYNVTVSSNVISNNKGNGVYMYSYGIGYYDSGNGYIYDVKFESNTVSGNIGEGISLGAYGFAVGTLLGDAYGYGYIYDVNASRNTVSNNGENGLYLYSSSGVGVGYAYSYVYDVTVLSNDFSSNGENGMLAESKNHYEQSMFDLEILENNVSANAQKGICIGGGLDSKIAGNAISYNMYGVYYAVTQNNKADSNNIHENTYGMNVTDGATVDAEYNYWGDPSGPYHEALNPDGKGNSVNGNGADLDFIPFLANAVVSAPPRARYVYAPEHPAVGGILTFDASGSYDRDGFIVSYQWDFGDGNITTVANPIIVHVYSVVNTYTVTLRVTDNSGGGDDIARSVTVKIGSTITLFVDPATVEVGSSVTMNGTISPSKVDVEVTISYRVSGEAWITLVTVMTDSQSDYTRVWNTTYVGMYEIKSSWLGDLETWEAESDVKTITVQGEPKTWIVDDDGPADFRSIQEAINAARHPEDIVRVHNGTYRENVVANKTLALVGENSDTTIIDEGGVLIIANNVSVSGFTIRNFAGVYISHSYGSAVNGNIISGNWYGAGIYIEYSNHIHIENNILTLNNPPWQSGIITITDSRENVILANEIYNIEQSHGIALERSSGNIISGNNITGGYGGVALIDSNDNILSNNKVMRTYTSGITLSGSSNNIISDNNIQESPLETWWRYAIELDESSSNTITANNISQCQNGILLGRSSSNNVISSNRIDNCKYWDGGAIYISASLNNRIYHNDFVDNKKQVQSYSSSNVWDDGYPSGGNYWSDYNGYDSNHDGIGDTSYFIDENNTDHYPLMVPYVVPEFPSFLILPLFMIVTLLAVIVYERKGAPVE